MNERHFNIQCLYKEILERDADLEGLLYYYNSDYKISEIRYKLINSIEYQFLQENKKDAKIKYLLLSNKTPILMPMYNRPNYLIQTIDALRKCEGISNFFIITFEEPDELCSEIMDSVDFVDIIRNKNNEKFGINKNFEHLFKIALKFEKFIVLEDDIVPEIDFLNYFNWAFDNTKSDDNIKTICAYSRSSDKDIYGTCIDNRFCPWGWGAWTNKVKELIDFNLSEYHDGYDVYIDEEFRKNGYNCLYPQISRVQNIGEVGTYVPSPEWHKENQRTTLTSAQFSECPIVQFTHYN